MRFRGTFFAILLFAGLLAFVYFYEYKGEDAREEASRAEDNALNFDREKVAGVEIERPGAEKIALSRDGKNWQMTSPKPTRADAEKVDALLSGLGWLRIERRIEGVTEVEKEAFGLTAPAARVTLLLPEAASPAEKQVTLGIGGAAQVGGHRYAATQSSSDVLLISGSLESILTADTMALRYKKVVGINSWDVTRFSVAAGASTVSLVKQSDDWLLAGVGGAADFPADSTKVTNLWSEVQSVEADGFQADGGSVNLETFGLARPALTLTVEAREVTGALRVEFGRSASGTVHARRSDMDAVLDVKSEVLEKLEKAALAPDDLRDARVAPVDRYRLKQLTMDRAGTTTVLFKDDESKWRWGAADGAALDSEIVNPLLDAIEGLKAARYLSVASGSHGEGESSVLRLTMVEGGGEGEAARTVTVTVTPRTEGPDSGRVVLSSAASVIYVVPQTSVQTLIDLASLLKEPTAAPATLPADSSGTSSETGKEDGAP